MRAHPPRCARPVRPPPEGNKNIQMGTHRHTHPQMGILIVPLQLCTYTYTHSQLCTVSRTPPGVSTPGDPRLQKRTGSFPRLVPVRRGAERQGGGAAASGAPLPAHHPPSPWMPVWCAMAPCPAPPAPLEPSAQPWTRSVRPAREEEEDVAATAQPRAASRAVPQDRPSAPRPRRARPGWGRELGAARARTVRLVPGGPRAGSQSVTPRACAGLFVAKNRACVGSSMRGRTRGCVSVRPEPSGWVSGCARPGVRARLCAPG